MRYFSVGLGTAVSKKGWTFVVGRIFPESHTAGQFYNNVPNSDTSESSSKLKISFDSIAGWDRKKEKAPSRRSSSTKKSESDDVFTNGSSNGIKSESGVFKQF